MNKTVTTLAFEAGILPFNVVHIREGEPDQIGERVAAILGDRNLYFTKEYRDRWGVQVHRIESSPMRMCLGVVESAQPADQAERRYRAVIFRCDGAVVYQTPDERALDFHSACIDMRYWINHIDEGRVLTDLCKQTVRSATTNRTKAEQVLLQLTKQGP